MFIAALFAIAPNCTTQMCFSGWMVKEIVAHPWNEIIPSNKKERIIDTRNTLNGWQVNYAEWKKPVSKGCPVWLFSRYFSLKYWFFSFTQCVWNYFLDFQVDLIFLNLFLILLHCGIWFCYSCFQHWLKDFGWPKLWWFCKFLLIY